MATGTVTEEADLVYDYEGTGPVLLAIAGGGGDGARYAAISAALADGYSVVRYDRRGRARSTAAQARIRHRPAGARRSGHYPASGEQDTCSAAAAARISVSR